MEWKRFWEFVESGMTAIHQLVFNYVSMGFQVGRIQLRLLAEDRQCVASVCISSPQRQCSRASWRWTAVSHPETKTVDPLWKTRARANWQLHLADSHRAWWQHTTRLEACQESRSPLPEMADMCLSNGPCGLQGKRFRLSPWLECSWREPLEEHCEQAAIFHELVSLCTVQGAAQMMMGFQVLDT